jgi:hypothetical protein
MFLPASAYAQIFIFYILRPAISFFCGSTMMSVVSYFLINKPLYFDGNPYRKFSIAILCIYGTCLVLAVLSPQNFFLTGLLRDLVTFSANNISDALVSSPIFMLAGACMAYGLVSKQVKVQPVRGWF